MSHSKYLSTPQTTNAARLARVISGPCTDLMRDVLRWRIPDRDFNHKLLVYESSIKHRLTQPQRDMLYPQSGPCTARYTDFDISLLYLLLRNICNISPHSKGWGHPPAPNDNSVSANIDRIREIRNKYFGHSSLSSLSDSEFSRVWNEVRQIVQCLEFIISGPSITYTNAVDVLKTVTMDPEQEQKLLDELDIQRRQDTEAKILMEQIRGEQEIQREIQNQQKEIQVQQGEIQSRQTKLLADHGEQLTEYKDTQDRQAIDIQLLKSEMENFDHETENIIREQEIEREIQNQQKEIQVQQGEIQSRQTKLLADHEEQLTEYKDTQDRQAIDIQLLKSEMENFDHETENIIVNSKAVLSRHACSTTYTETKAAITGLNRLREQKVLIMSGKGGEGKTTTARQIMSTFSADHTRVILDYLDPWDKIVNSNKKMVILLDDIFGRTNPDVSLIEKQRSKFDKILSSAQHGSVHVIIAIRQNILRDIRTMFPEQQLFHEKFELNMSSDEHIKITNQEKKNMMKHYIRSLQGEEFDCYFRWPNEECEFTLCSWNVEEIIKSDPYFGFPQTCHLFFSRKEFFGLGPGFFKHPHESLFKDIENMRKTSDFKVRYCVLAYVFVYQQIDTDNISCTAFTKISKEVRLTDFTVQDIKDAAEDLQGPYLCSNEEDDCIYTFSHETVLEAVLLSFGQLSPETVIQNCDRSAVYELIRTKGYKKKPEEIVLRVPKHNYPALVEKLFKINKEGDSFDARGFLAHSATEDNDFIDAMFSSDHGEKYFEMYKEIIKVVSDLNKPEMVNALLSHGCLESDGTNIIYRRLHLGISCVCDNSASHLRFIITKTDICKILNKSIKNKRKSQTLIVCKYINRLANPDEFYNRDVFFEAVDYGDEMLDLFYHNEDRETYKPFHHCVMECWDSIVDVILAVHKPSKDDIYRLFQNIIMNGSEQSMLMLCTYVQSLENVSEYFKHSIEVILCDEFTIVHHCVARGWDDAVDYILQAHLPTKTHRNWSCLHLAAFFGRVSLIKYFVNKGHCVAERTTEGYSVLQTLLLGLREGERKEFYFFTYLDVEKSYCYRGIQSSDDDSFMEAIQYVLMRDASLSGDLNLTLDKCGNSIIYYLVIHNRQKIFDYIIERVTGISYVTNNVDLPTVSHVAIFLGRDKMLQKLLGRLLPEESVHERSLLRALFLGLKYKDRVKFYTEIGTFAALSSDENFIETLRYLLSLIPSVIDDISFHLDDDGHSIIYFLVYHNREAMFDLLLQKGANIRECSDLKAALALAVYCGRISFVMKLWDLCGTEKAIEEPAIIIPFIKRLQRCQDIYWCLKYGLLEISKNASNYRNIMQYILEKHPPLVQHFDMTLDENENNIIHYLVIYKSESILDMLLQHYLHILHHRNRSQLPTTLHVASYLGRYNIVNTLWNAGVRPAPNDMSLLDAARDGKKYCGLPLQYVCDSVFQIKNGRLEAVNRNKWVHSLDDVPYGTVYDAKLVVTTNSRVCWGGEDDFQETERFLEGLNTNVLENN